MVVFLQGNRQEYNRTSRIWSAIAAGRTVGYSYFSNIRCSLGGGSLTSVGVLRREVHLPGTLLQMNYCPQVLPHVLLLSHNASPYQQTRQTSKNARKIVPPVILLSLLHRSINALPFLVVLGCASPLSRCLSPCLSHACLRSCPAPSRCLRPCLSPVPLSQVVPQNCKPACLSARGQCCSASWYIAEPGPAGCPVMCSPHVWTT